MKNIFIVVLLSFVVAHAESYTSVTFADLQGKVEAYDDPFKKLTEEQIYHLSIYARVSEMQKKSHNRVNDAMRKELIESEKILVKEGIDINGLLAQREHIQSLRKKAAYAPNIELNNTKISMGGYMLSLALNEKGKVQEFLLVPTLGACIHTPPPPPNQIVYVKTDTPIEPEARFIPVRIEGQILVKVSSNELYLVDGSDDINSGYIMNATKVEKYSIESK